MARIRSIKPEFFQSISIAQLTPWARLLFIGLWTHGDDAGRGLDEPRLLKASIFPLDDDITPATIDELMGELAEAGRVVRYDACGRPVYQIANFLEHQRIDRASESKYPEPEGSTIVRRMLDEDAPTARSRVRARAPGSGSGSDRIGGDLSGESDVEPSLLPAVIEPAGKPANQDPIWDALAVELGEAVTATERGIRGKTTKELRAAKATPDQIHTRCAEYRDRWPDMSLTDSSLRKYWTVLATPHTNGTAPKLNDSSKALVRAAARRMGESA